MIWLGTSGFQYPEWKGKFYPEKMPAAKMLAYYAGRFTSTESNYSFRTIPSRKTIDSWSEKTPAQFKFTFKALQRITHFARLKECTELTATFFAAISPMEEKLGAVLFQLPPNFTKDLPLLDAFLSELPPAMRPAFEFRHDSWFDDAVFECLRAHRAALCIAENEDLATPAVATADFGYLRLRRTDYTAKDLARWAGLARNQTTWKDTFVYFKHEETGVGPEFAQQFADLFKT